MFGRGRPCRNRVTWPLTKYTSTNGSTYTLHPATATGDKTASLPNLIAEASVFLHISVKDVQNLRLSLISSHLLPSTLRKAAAETVVTCDCLSVEARHTKKLARARARTRFLCARARAHARARARSPFAVIHAGSTAPLPRPAGPRTAPATKKHHN